MDSKKLLKAFAMLLGIIGFGTIGYYYFEKMPLFDAFYKPAKYLRAAEKMMYPDFHHLFGPFCPI